MNHDQTDDTNSQISRRTGLDRRWIASSAHHPERRSGKDRRVSRKRAFLEIIESTDPQTDTPAISDPAFRPVSTDKNR